MNNYKNILAIFLNRLITTIQHHNILMNLFKLQKPQTLQKLHTNL